MNWDAIGAIGQMLGSLAVFVTLAYLAVQQRHARAEVRRSVSQGRSAATRELSMFTAGNELVAKAKLKAYRALDGRPLALHKPLLDAGLTDEEIGAVIFDQFAYWAYRASMVMQIHEMAPGERTEFELGIRDAYGNGAGRLWYSTSKAGLNPDAVRYIDNLLAQPS